MLAVALIIPLPRSLTVPYITEYQVRQELYAATAGNVRYALKPGKHLVQGDRVVELDNRELRLELQTLLSERDNLQKRMEHLRSLRVSNGDVASQLPAIEELIALNASKLKLKQREANQLVLISEYDGILVPPRARGASDEQDDVKGWVGTPLDAQNINCYVPRGTLLGSVCTNSNRVSLMVDQREIDLIRIGQTARINYPGLGEILGHVRSVGASALDSIEPEFSAKSLVPSKQSSLGELLPMNPTYLVEIELNQESPVPLSGRVTGYANVAVESASIL